jgi:hypothetical protein
VAIFTAGCIESTRSSNQIRNRVYALAKHDLDSPAMKISVRKSPTCINFIAFLPKEKIVYENILKVISQTVKRCVVIFELDYKHVGIVCEKQRIVDYILDKPTEFAQERGYDTTFVDNAKGVKLVSFNLSQKSKEAWAGSVSLGFTILMTTLIFYSGYFYMKDTQINKETKESLVKEYTSIVRKEFKKSEKITKKIDMVNVLEDVERLTKATHARLLQVKYSKNNFCVAVKALQMEPFLAMLPQNTKITHKDTLNATIEYCYEKI